MKSESTEFQELFGASSLDQITPMIHPKPEPQLPTDNPLWDYECVTGGRSAEQVQDEQFIKDVSGCETIRGSGVAQPATQAGLNLLQLVRGANARNAMNKGTRAGITREELTRRMTKHYSHAVWRGWEKMMESCVGDDEFSEEKALSFLR
jgi:hypothetical protein